MMARLQLVLFGGLTLHLDGKLSANLKSQKAHALLCYLAVTGREHPRSALAGLLWPDVPEVNARMNLRKELTRLRRAVAPYLEITRETLVFDRSSDYRLDVEQFEQLVQGSADREGLVEAVQLYQGDFLAGFEVLSAPSFDDWVQLERTRLREAYLQTLQQLAADYEAEDDLKTAIKYNRQLLDSDPWREEVQRHLMRLYAANDQRSLALAQYELCRQALAEELGVEPGIETMALYDQIRAGADKVAKRPPPAIVAPASDLVDAPRDDLLEMPDTGVFFGREDELAQLNTWIVNEGCQLSVILGVGGMGKTSLAARFVTSLLDQANNMTGSERPFVKIMWRSLLNAPPLTTLLQHSILFLSDQQIIDIPASLDEQFRLLLKLLHQQRCLLILDNAESIMQAGERPRRFRTGYEGYGQLIQLLAQTDHQSCLLLTSRERPEGFARLARDNPQVRFLQLQGLPDEAARQILAQHRLSGAEAYTVTLIECYSGHPLALKLVAETIDELYFGDVAAFLAEETLIFADIGDVLDQQFARLSSLEQEIMTWLAIEREPISVQVLSNNLLGPVTQREFLEALRALQGHSLLEKQNEGFGLQNVISEYTTDRFINQIGQELGRDILETFNRYALLKAQAKDYVRESQQRLILQPIAENLVAKFGQVVLEQRLKDALDRLRLDLPKGYAGGNILNLLLHLKSDLRSFDFSGIAVWQAYLQGMTVHNVDFSQADLSGAVFTDTFGMVDAVSFSPNGQHVAASTLQGQLRLWRISDRQLLRSFAGHTAGIDALCFSPDGRVIASGSVDHTVRLWDVTTGRLLITLTRHSAPVLSVHFSPNGKVLASASQDKTVRLWDAFTGQHIKTLSGHTDIVWSICFSPDGNLLASGSGDHTIRLWDANTGQYLKTLPGHTDRVCSVCFSPDGHLLASGSGDHTVRLWEISEEIGVDGETSFRMLRQHTGWVRFVTFSPDGKFLASTSEDRTIRLWDIRQSGQLFKTLQGHVSWVSSASFSPDGRMLVSGSADQTVRLWDTHTGQSLQTLHGHINSIWSVCFSPNGKLLASGSFDGQVRLFAPETGRVIKALSGHKNAISSVCFSPDGKLLVSGSDAGTVRLWDVNAEQVLTASEALKVIRDHTDSVWSVCFSPDGRLLASGSSDLTVRLFDVHTAQALKTLSSYTHPVLSVCFSPDGRLLASGSMDRLVRLFDVGTGQLFKTLTGHTDWVWCVIFSPDGKLLASAGGDGTIRLWNIDTGREIAGLQGHLDEVTTICFSPDGRRLASSSGDRTICIWDVSDLEIMDKQHMSKPVYTLRGHTASVRSVSFSPDGNFLVSGSDDETIKLWDGRMWECLKTIRPEGPYGRMYITGVQGLTEAQKTTLTALGAVTD